MGSVSVPAELSLVPQRRSGDLAGTWGAVLLLWVLPIGLGVGASAVVSLGWPLRDAYATWIVSTGWLGSACLANAHRCGRVHCWVDGVGMPSLAVVGIFALAGLVPLSLHGYGIAFWGILAASFCVELCWRRYV